MQAPSLRAPPENLGISGAEMSRAGAFCRLFEDMFMESGRNVMYHDVLMIIINDNLDNFNQTCLLIKGVLMY